MFFLQTNVFAFHFPRWMSSWKSTVERGSLFWVFPAINLVIRRILQMMKFWTLWSMFDLGRALNLGLRCSVRCRSMVMRHTPCLSTWRRNCHTLSTKTQVTAICWWRLQKIYCGVQCEDQMCLGILRNFWLTQKESHFRDTAGIFSLQILHMTLRNCYLKTNITEEHWH